MKQKLTQKQENFCLNLIKGMSQREAYAKAGYSANQLPATQDRNAFELASSNKILARLEELRAPIEAEVALSASKRKEILAKIATATPADILELSEDERDTRLKPEALDSPAVSYIRTEQVSIGKMPVRITRVGMTDKIRAIAELNKMEGDYAPEKRRVEVERVESFVFILPDGQKLSPKQLIEGKTTPGNGE